MIGFNVHKFNLAISDHFDTLAIYFAPLATVYVNYLGTVQQYHQIIIEIVPDFFLSQLRFVLYVVVRASDPLQRRPRLLLVACLPMSF